VAFCAGRTSLGAPKCGKSGEFFRGATVQMAQNSININQ